MFKFDLRFPGFLVPMIRSARPILAARAFLCATAILFAFLTCTAYSADDGSPTTLPASLLPGLPSWFPQLLGAQATFIYQNVPAFHSPYTGEDSLRFDHGLGQEMSQTYGVYLGSQITRYFQTYLDVEMFQGQGLSKGIGVAGYTNGDVIRRDQRTLGIPLRCPLLGRYLIPLPGEQGDPLERGMDQLAGKEPADRIEIKGGKLSPSDDFDLNRYANNQPTSSSTTTFFTIRRGTMHPTRGATPMASPSQSSIRPGG